MTALDNPFDILNHFNNFEISAKNPESRPISNILHFGQINHQSPNDVKLLTSNTDNNLITDSKLTLTLTPSTRTRITKKNIYLPLRGINPHEIWEKYNQGFFEKVIIPSTKINQSNKSDKYFKCPLSNDQNDEKYQEIEDGQTHLILTTDHADFQAANDIIQRGQDPRNIQLLKKGLCRWCRKELSTMDDDAYPCSIVVKVIRIADFYIFYGLNKYCHMGCMYADFLQLINQPFGDSQLEDCEPWIKLMFNLYYPDQELVPAPDWTLHQRNGGHLDDNSYYSTQYIYYKRPNVILLPTKQEFGVIPR